MRVDRRTAALAAAVATGIAACAPSAQWTHPVLDERYWPHDVDACEGRAWAEAERDFAFRNPTINAPWRWPNRGLGADIARYEAQERAADLFAACMKSRGYRLVESTEDE